MLRFASHLCFEKHDTVGVLRVCTLCQQVTAVHLFLLMNHITARNRLVRRSCSRRSGVAAEQAAYLELLLDDDLRALQHLRPKHEWRVAGA